MRRAAVLDTALVMLFVLVGRRNHDEGSAPLGIARTAWPFLVGLAVGWRVTTAWDRAPQGVVVWLSTVTVGMLLRAVSGQGLAFSFVVVTLVVLGAFLLGWRALAPVLARRRRLASPG